MSKIEAARQLGETLRSIHPHGDGIFFLVILPFCLGLAWISVMGGDDDHQ